MNKTYTLEVIREIQRTLKDARQTHHKLLDGLVEINDSVALGHWKVIRDKQARISNLLQDIEGTLEEELYDLNF